MRLSEGRLRRVSWSPSPPSQPYGVLSEPLICVVVFAGHYRVNAWSVRWKNVADVPPHTDTVAIFSEKYPSRVKAVAENIPWPLSSKSFGCGPRNMTIHKLVSRKDIYGLLTARYMNL